MTPVTLIIPAAGTQSGVFAYQASGRYFLLTSTTGAFRVISNTGDEYDFSETGSGFGNDNSPPFGKLTFYNDSGTPVTITFYVSNTPIKTPDVTVQSSITVNTTITNTLAGCAAATLSSAVVTAALINTAYKFNAASTPFRKITILAFSGFGTPGTAPTVNAGIVFIGVSNTQQPIAMNPGDVWTFEAPTGAKYDLNAFYLSAASAGDGILIIYS
ncbi:MAG TPA: hypothetical protein VNV43_00210 [Candidatus Acidoferrales bacterium]|jgi:hypothetical protein|nr:hypothetical protein [Candidatus Acidoferrales bacterium]